MVEFLKILLGGLINHSYIEFGSLFEGRPRREVIPVGRKRNQKIELANLRELRKTIREIKKRREKMYKRLANQLKERKVS